MRRIYGFSVLSGLLALALGTPANAQVGVTFGNPYSGQSVTVGTAGNGGVYVAPGGYGSGAYGSPYYGNGWANPYGGYGVARTYSSGYAGYGAPAYSTTTTYYGSRPGYGGWGNRYGYPAYGYSGYNYPAYGYRRGVFRRW